MSKLDEILDAHSVVCYDAADYKSYQSSVEIISDCRKEIESALNLQELVKEEIKNVEYKIKHFIPEWEISSYTIPVLEGELRILQHLIEQSENTDKEKGLEGTK